MTTQTDPRVTHLGRCDGPRQLDITEHDSGVTTAHCPDCGAHEAYGADGTSMPAPADTGAFYADERPSVFDGITIERMEGSR